MLKKFFAPYEEYILHTSLPQAELRPCLEQSCPKVFSAAFFVQRLRGLFAYSGEPELAISRRGPIVLSPTTGSRNFLRGKIELLPLAEDASGTRLQVTIRPADRRWLVILFVLLAAVYSVSAAIRGSKWSLLCLPGAVLFLWLLMLVGREIARNDTPALKAALENKIRTVEAEKLSLDYYNNELASRIGRKTHRH